MRSGSTRQAELLVKLAEKSTEAVVAGLIKAVRRLSIALRKSLTWTVDQSSPIMREPHWNRWQIHFAAGHQGTGCTTNASVPAMNTVLPSGVMAMYSG